LSLSGSLVGLFRASLKKCEDWALGGCLDNWFAGLFESVQRASVLASILVVFLFTLEPGALCLEDWFGLVVLMGFPSAVLWGLEVLRRRVGWTPSVALSCFVFLCMSSFKLPAFAVYGASLLGVLRALDGVARDLSSMGSRAVLVVEGFLDGLWVGLNPCGAFSASRVGGVLSLEHRTSAQRGLIRYSSGGEDDEDEGGCWRSLWLVLVGEVLAGAGVGWRWFTGGWRGLGGFSVLGVWF